MGTPDLGLFIVDESGGEKTIFDTGDTPFSPPGGAAVMIPTPGAEAQQVRWESEDLWHRTGDYLLALAEQEVIQREQNAFALRMKQAGFPVAKSFEGFDFTASPGIDKQRMLQLAECHWIENAEVVILVGNPGVGKSHCATALGYGSVPAGQARVASSRPRGWPRPSWRPRRRCSMASWRASWNAPTS
ncbi:MAG: ATP-binding protein [Gammaproteobacteria bacterium]|nr:ATP-binding protein [Gammaproteobacteria bacterium]